MTITAQSADGLTHEFPDGTDPAVIDKVMKNYAMQQAPVAAPQETPVSLEGSLASVGSGIAKGAAGLGGAFADTSNFNSDLLRGGAEMLGTPQWAQDAAGMFGKYSLGPLGLGPTTDQLTQATESVTGPLHEPQNVTEEYLQTGGEFLPAAIAGPGGVVRKAAMTLIPAVASETAGQLTKGEESEPYARLAGAIAGGVAASGRGGNAMKQLRKSAPNLEQVGEQTNAAYKRLRDAGIQFDDNAYRSFAMSVVNKLRNHGWRPRDGDPISGDIKEIVSRVGKPNNWDEIESLRKYVGNLPKTASDTDFARAGIIRNALDELVDSGKLISTKGIDPSVIGTMAKQARELGRKNIIGKKIAKMGDKSEWYLGGEESGLRNQVASFGKKQGNSLEPAEKAAFKKVVNREGLLNALNTTGSRMGQIVLGGAGLATGGVPGAMATMVAHLVARKGSEVLTKRAVKEALETVLAGRPAQKAAHRIDRLTAKEIMARRLLSAASGQNSAANR